MQPERSLVPYHTTPIESAPILVFAPHLDDEIFGMGGTLLLAKQQKLDIKIIYVTLGQKGGDPEVRKQEATQCCEALGASYEFLEYVDREVQVTHETIEHFTQIIAEHSQYHIYFPSPLEFHPDHRAVATLVWRGAQEAKHKQPLFSYEISRQSEINVLRDITSVRAQKTELMMGYQSQLTENNYVEIVESISKARTYTLPKDVEYAEGFFRFEHGWGLLKNRFYELQHRAFNDILPSERPVISILIRTQNRHDYLERALESVRAQNYRRNLEIVVVNDGGEPVNDVVDAYRLDFFKLKVVDLPQSLGRAAAANAALINCTGAFVNFLDDDDEFKENHIAVFLHHWRKDNSIDVLYRGVEVRSNTGDVVRVYNDPYDAGRLMHGNYIPIHAVTFSRKFIDMGCRFDENLEHFEDWDFWIQLSRLTPFFHVPTITSFYHMVGSSAASPHMRGVLDSVNHNSRVVDKWMGRWTSVERNRMLQAIIKYSK